MALIVITITDEDNDTVDVRSIAEPALPIGHMEDATPAHGVALAVLSALAETEAAATEVY